jgi:CDP-alcohol phosphatidyltransferase-like enzyme
MPAYPARYAPTTLTSATLAGTPGAPPAVRGGTSVDTAVLFATAASDDGGPAALLPWDGGTILSRVVAQLASLGVQRVHVITRPAWEAHVRAATDAPVRTSATLPDDLRAVAELASGATGLVAMHGDIVTHREALAGLLADPRVSTGVLVGGRARAMQFRIRARRGRILSAASPYHAVHRPSGASLGVLKTAPGDLALLAATAERLAGVTATPPSAWGEELDRKTGSWRLSLYRASITDEDATLDDTPDEGVELEETEPLDPWSVELSDEDEVRLQLRRSAAQEDAVALLLVGLVRAGVQVGPSHLRRLFWSRPLTRDRLTVAAEAITEYDEDRVLLESAVKGSDGFFTTFFVSPYSKYIARWAARRGFTPNQVTTASVFIGLLAAIAFATGERWGLITGAVLLQAAFTTDCVDGQLARYTRTFSKLGAWLDSVFDRTKEYLAFAGLAIGASRAGDPVWLLACIAITLQTVRHMSDFSFGGSQQQVLGATPQPPVEQPLDAAGAAAEKRRNGAVEEEPTAHKPLPERVLGAWRQLDRGPGVRWLKKMIAFPIGERFAVISITAALWDARVTFIALLAWGGLAALYTQTGRILRSV